MVVTCILGHWMLKGQKVAAPLNNFGNFLEEIGAFDFLLRRTPCHIVREQVCKNSLAQGNAESPKKEEAGPQINPSSNDDGW